MTVIRSALITVLLSTLLAAPVESAGTPADYLVFRVDPDGTVQLAYRTRVTLREPLRSANARTLQRAGTRDRDHVVARLRSAQGAVVFEDVVEIPRWLRGEFHGAAGKKGEFAIDGHVLPATGAAFVVRVPIVDGATLALESGLATKAAEFQLGAFPRTAVAPPPFPPPLPGWNNGASTNRVDLLILGDGYTAAQQTGFENDSLNLANSFFTITPYYEYRNYVNVAALFTPSNQSGADQPPYDSMCNQYARIQTCCGDPMGGGPPTTVDTAFDGTFCSYNIQRLVTVDFAKVLYAASGSPDWDIIMVLVNSGWYGGSGGGISVVTTNGAAVQVAQHEHGHSFTLLADEYESPYPGYPSCTDVGGSSCESNVTNQTTRALIKWNRWIDPMQAVPSFEPVPYWGSAGLFEGARYLTTGMYRQGFSCAMRTLGAIFCDVPSEAYVLRLYQGGWGVPYAGIDNIEPGSEVPAPGAVSAPYPGGTYAATVLGPQAGPGVVAEWYVDGGLVDTQTVATGDDAVHDLATTEGPHTLELRVTDVSPIIHPTMRASVASSRTWNVTVGPNLCGNSVLDGSETCDDANPNGGDGCSATCHVESCWACVGLPSVCAPDDGAPCDDGDTCTVDETCGATICGDGTPVTACVSGDDCCPPGCVAPTDLDCVPPTPTPTPTSTPTVTVTPTPICPETDLGSAIPVTQSGSTTGAPNAFSGSCGGGSARERGFRYTAPASTTYTITTGDPGTNFDTVMYVRAGGCGGAQIGCDDDSAGGLKSRLDLPLVAGQEIAIFVDGFGGQSGSFVLHIDPVAPTPTPTSTPTPTCGGAPVAGCRTPAPQGGSLQLKNTGPPDTKDQLQWKWSKGPVTTKAEFGSPTSTDNYQLCIYDGTSNLVIDATIPAGGACGTTSFQPCWKDKTKGFDYKNKALTPDGIEQLKLKEGLIPGKTQIQVKGKGVLLDDLTLPVSQPLTVQLHNTASGLCWESTFSAPASKNVAGPPGQFKDKAD